VKSACRLDDREVCIRKEKAVVTDGEGRGERGRRGKCERAGLGWYIDKEPVCVLPSGGRAGTHAGDTSDCCTRIEVGIPSASR
jgi:hypothetical protein